MKRSIERLPVSMAVFAFTLLISANASIAAQDAEGGRLLAATPASKTTGKPGATKAGATKAKSGAKAPSAKVAPGKGAAQEADEAPASATLPSVETGVQQSAGLTAALTAFKTHPEPTQWPVIFKELRDVIASPQGSHASAGSILHANPLLTDVGIKVDDAAGARIWAFPKQPESQAVLVQYLCPVGAPSRKTVGKGRHRKVVVVPPPMVTKLQMIALPPTMAFKDAQIVRSSAKNDLILAGNERSGGTIMIVAYRLNDGVWGEDAGVLSNIPPFLVQNVAGSPSFSGNDLVLTLGAAGAQSSGYKIVLKFVEGKFSMEGQAADAGPSMIALQFMQSLQQNRLDVARAWLADPRLISVPKYAGLLNRTSDRPFKIIAMSAPLLQGSRFRVMTFDKNDLILDIGKVKNQWAIKAVFIAPPDPLAQKLVGTLPVSAAATAKPPTEK